MTAYLRPDDKACWLAVALGLSAVLWAIWYLVGYDHSALHPHFFIDNFNNLAPRESKPRFYDLLGIFAEIAGPEEHRPRFLMYLFVLLDYRLRLFLYDHFLILPTLSITWIAEIAAGTYFLFRLMTRLTRSRLAAAVTVIIYLSSIGFLSGLCAAIMPGKPLINVVFIGALYLAAGIHVKGIPGTLLFSVPGFQKYLLLLLLLIGPLLDELPLFAFPLVVLMFPRRFWSHQNSSWREVLPNLAWLAMPLAAFLIFSILGAPVLTLAVHGYSFDYIGTLLNQKSADDSGMFGVFSLFMLCFNFISLFDTSAFPSQLFAENLFVRTLAICLVLAFPLIAYIRSDEKPARALIRRSFTAIAAFVVFFAIVSGRHGGYGSGYYYGSAFSVFFAILMGAGFAANRTPGYRVAYLLLTIFIVVIQINNTIVSQKKFAEVHNAISADLLRDRISSTDRPVTYAELRSLWDEWKGGRLEEALQKRPISSGALYLAVELSWLDQMKRKR